MEDSLSLRHAVGCDEADGLEDRLRNQITELLQAGLAPDEAFIIAVKRLEDQRGGQPEHWLEHWLEHWPKGIGSVSSESTQEQSERPSEKPDTTSDGGLAPPGDCQHTRERPSGKPDTTSGRAHHRRQHHEQAERPRGRLARAGPCAPLGAVDHEQAERPRGRLAPVVEAGNDDAAGRDLRGGDGLAAGGGPGNDGAAGRDLRVMLGFAVVAAVGVKVPELFGVGLADDADFYARNLSLLALVPPIGYFVWRRGMPAGRSLRLLGLPVFAAAVAVNAYPFKDGSDTAVLAALHLPVAMWLLLGVAHAGGDWRSQRARMDFVRFTGEWFVHYALIALGGGLLAGFTLGAFAAIGINAQEFAQEWLLPCGAGGAVVVTAWLAEARQGAVGGMAPLLARLFTPLFAAMLLALLAAMVWTRRGIDFDRDVLIFFDLLLAVVLGLVLYGVSARDPRAPHGLFDQLQLVLVAAALAADALMLTAMAGRITDFGLTPNRVAALGENLVLLVNLAWSARLCLGFWRGRAPIESLERWQTSYAPVYAVWATAVTIVFPPVFGFA